MGCSFLVSDFTPSPCFGDRSCSGYPSIVSRNAVADTFKSEKLEDAAEFGRIGRYYALEDMLTTDPSEKYGRTTLRQHYERIAVEGQEYDPYTSVCVANRLFTLLQPSACMVLA